VIDGIIRYHQKEDLSKETVVRVYDLQSLIQRPFTASHTSALEELVRQITTPPDQAWAAWAGMGVWAV